MLASLVFTILKPSMTESIRRAGIPEIQKLGSVRTGIEGFADGMSIFPRLKEWENQIALQALRERKTVDDLRGITPFRQYLGVAKRATNAGRNDPFIPFANLFDAGPSIDMLVSLGNFHTIRTWTWTLAKQHPEVNLPLEQFFQDALYHIVPAQAKSYDPSYGRTSTSYVVSMLKKRFSNFVDAHKTAYTTPVSYDGRNETTKGRPRASSKRTWFASLDARMPRATSPQMFLEFYEESHPAPVESTRQDDQEARQRIHILSTLAGLSDTQEETLVGIFVYGADTTLLSRLRRSTDRAIRYQRQVALENIGALGFETVNGVLIGKYETLEAARASMQTSENIYLDGRKQAT